MQHYFIDKEHKESDFFTFNENINGQKFAFLSCDSIFSKKSIDKGSLALIKAIDKYLSLKGEGLDFGCGYGVLAIYLMKNYDVTIDMLDVNKTALYLAKQNFKNNGLQNKTEFFESNVFSNNNKIYDFIISNPPIKAGKSVLFEFLKESYNHLKTGGTLTMVIRKDAGMESAKKCLFQIYDNCQILMRDKGYYILHCIKQLEK